MRNVSFAITKASQFGIHKKPKRFSNYLLKYSNCQPMNPLNYPLKDPKCADGFFKINAESSCNSTDCIKLSGAAITNRSIRLSPRKSKAKDTNNDSTSPNQTEPRSQNIRSDGPLRCDHCGKEFLRKCRLARHVNTYKHRCSICDQVFRLRNDLKLHVNENHGPVMYPCNSCEYKSTNKWTLKDHIIRKHTSSYHYSCTVCQKKFKLKNDLKQHTNQMHNDAPPIICSVCGHASKSVPASKAHMKYRHYKPAFECSLCKRCLSTQNSLDQHLLWHEKKEKVVCPTCGKTFGQKRDLEIHLRIHEGIRPYACPFCGKTFRRKNAQEQHMLIHTGMRPYTCDICGQGFTQKPGLICHRKRHPGPLPPLPVISVKKLIMDYTQGLHTVPKEFQENPKREDDGDRLQGKEDRLV